MIRRKAWLIGAALLLLTACDNGGTPPSVTIIAPANDATVSGTAAVQVTLGDTQSNAEVRVYARGREGKEDGQLLGTVNTSPYIVTWNTSAFPSNTPLDLYAKATTKATGTSAPVRVQVQNATAPTLAYMVAYNLPAGLTSASLGSASPRLPKLDPQAIRVPAGVQATALPAASVSSQATGDRQLAVEWAWKPVDGAGGYRVLLGRKSIAGPYDLMDSPAASAGGVALERRSKYLTDTNVGDRLYGAVRSFPLGGADSAVSNAQTAVFLDTQQVASPIDGQVVSDGRPILTWTPLSGVSGYLYFLCDRPCTQDAATTLWSNYPNTTSNLSATYPSSADKLPSGTYYWWVAGVRQEKGVIVSLSYSEQRRLVVP